MTTRYKKRIIELTVNEETYELAVECQETLIDVLRRNLGLTGTKVGCGTGECGACTVLLEGEPVLACLTLAVECENKKIDTIEGQSINGNMTPVQKAFLEKGAVQCGFCTPGMVLASTDLLKRNPDPSREDIMESLGGHLCRCTGYNKILESVQHAVKLNQGQPLKEYENE